MRGTPGGKHPTASIVVGFTGSLESATPSGPNDGLFSFILSRAQAVIGGSPAVKVPRRYRVADEVRMLHTPDKSGVVELFCSANVIDENATTDTKAKNTMIARFCMLTSVTAIALGWYREPAP